MGSEMIDYMASLKEDVLELKRLGKEWGMTENDIKSCIDQVLESSEENGKLARNIWRYIRFLVKIPLYLLFAFALLAIALTLLTTFHAPTENLVNKVLQPHGYAIFRYLRLATLPIHRFVNITAYYDSECIINNPFYIEPEAECFNCLNFKSVKRANVSDFAPNKLYSYMEVMKPILFKDDLSSNVTYQDLRQLYLAETEDLEAGLKEFESSDPSVIDNLQQLFEEDQGETINQTQALHIGWESFRQQGSTALSTLFPRPKFLPKKCEVNQERRVLIDGPKVKTYELPYDSVPTQLYTQASGQRRVLLQPHEVCKTRCESLLILMEAGSTLAFNNDIWRVHLLTNGNRTSVGYHTSILMIK